MKKIDSYEHARLLMVSQQIERRGIRDQRLLQVMRTVPRHLFVDEQYQVQAYEDYPLRIGKGQTISQPYIVALMTELLHLKGDETVLEVGTGSGYQAAVLAGLAKTVHTIERYAELAADASAVLKNLGLSNVVVHVGDGSMGWESGAPYEGILVTAAAPDVPKVLLRQLNEGGRMVIPVGDRYMQELQVWTREGDNFTCQKNIAVAFVPLRGKYGWREKDWF